MIADRKDEFRRVLAPDFKVGAMGVDCGGDQRGGLIRTWGGDPNGKGPFIYGSGDVDRKPIPITGRYHAANDLVATADTRQPSGEIEADRARRYLCRLDKGWLFRSHRGEQVFGDPCQQPGRCGLAPLSPRLKRWREERVYVPHMRLDRSCHEPRVICDVRTRWHKGIQNDPCGR
ncbi:hypothetical protein [Jannaschia seosinensis]|uniref:hypothetical protein n=1 Tax=Jannaschia seosinensis TaxID=313367 RepID=UPI001187677A|nr:hypothetical protein [Jannaschia seosinensis]